MSKAVKWEGWSDAGVRAAYTARFRAERLPVEAAVTETGHGLHLQMGALARELQLFRTDGWPPRPC